MGINHLDSISFLFYAIASSTNSDHSNGKQSTNVPAPIANDFTKVKEPPLDLIAKPSAQPSDHVNNKPPAQLPSSISSDFTKVKESSLDLKFNYYPYKSVLILE